MADAVADTDDADETYASDVMVLGRQDDEPGVYLDQDDALRVAEGLDLLREYIGREGLPVDFHLARITALCRKCSEEGVGAIFADVVS